MKKRVGWIILIAFGVIVLKSVVFMFADNWYDSRQSELETQIEVVFQDYREGKTDTIEIVSIDYFEWDRVYSFGPYSNCEDVIKILDAPLYSHRCKLTGIEWGVYYLAVFSKNGIIVRDIVNSNLIFMNGHNGFDKDTSYFLPDIYKGLIWVGD